MVHLYSSSSVHLAPRTGAVLRPESRGQITKIQPIALTRTIIFHTNFYLETIILTTKVTCWTRDLNVNQSVLSELVIYTQTRH